MDSTELMAFELYCAFGIVAYLKHFKLPIIGLLLFSVALGCHTIVCISSFKGIRITKIVPIGD